MKNLIVIDDFYSNVDAVREFALTRVEYFEPKDLSEGFVGTESKQSFFSAGAIAKIENAIGQKIVVDPQNYSFAVFYKTFGKDEGRRTVHVDQSDWTGLVYLNKPEDCQGGTSFYQHIETGLDSVPNADRIQEMGFENREDFVKKFVSKEGKDLNRWKRIGRVGMKSNRMLLFRAGEMFHAADAYFGNSDTDCRLAQLFFFKIQGAAL